MTQEFLPLCDVLFNIISLASYFCDIVFDVLTVYTLYDTGQYEWFGVTFGFVAISLLASQVMSLKWYLRNCVKAQYRDCDVSLVFLVHFLQSGVLWRYFKLFIPVDLRYVKQAVRDLCLLRLVHAFCEAAPMLLIQMYWIWRTQSASETTQLTVVSTLLSLFSVCWALASFNKHIRQRNLHKLVLTWLGVIYQFLWRLGTVSSRVGALTLYATLYHFWVFLVIGLHWISMFLWLISPKNVFHGEKLSRTKKCVFSLLISYVYVFCYINLQEVNARQKMMAFYVTMFLENTLLMAVWIGQQSDVIWYKSLGVALVWGGFAFGIVFMLLYYRYFHVKRLKHAHALSDSIGTHHSSCTLCQLGSCSEHSNRTSSAYLYGETSTGDGLSTVATSTNPHGDGLNSNNGLGQLHNHSHQHNHHHHHHYHIGKNGIDRGGGVGSGGGVSYIPGVFNCRLNPAFKRKKKKPTTFIPMPVQQISMQPNAMSGKLDLPFWKKPLPKMHEDADSVSRSGINGTAGSRVNIQQKLQEKKRQQLQELRVIEEEIKQGKLQRPHPTEMSEQGTLRQPIPRSKKQPWVHPEMRHNCVSGLPKSRSKTPEILLAPHYLEHTRIYYDYGEEKWRFAPMAQKQEQQQQQQLQCDHLRHVASGEEHTDMLCKGYRISSDLDSQLSLPRSYTLPREFKYHRKPKTRKVVRTEHFVTSTNSSDGDVDSGDENDHDVHQHHHQQRFVGYRNLPIVGSPASVCSRSNRIPVNYYHQPGGYNLHETQL